VKERPILFTGAMVRAILDGRKTMTRRVVKREWPPHGGGTSRAFVPRDGKDDFVTFSQPYTDLQGEPIWFYSWGNARRLRCPYGAPGDRLWVREAFAYSVKDPDSFGEGFSRETHHAVPREGHHGGDWTHYEPDGNGGLVTTSVKPKWKPGIHMPRWASRLTLDVTAVRVERLQDITEDDARAEGFDSRTAIADAWTAMHGAGSWDANPWVWCIQFKRAEVTS
jgi:hypothetical protein